MAYWDKYRLGDGTTRHPRVCVIHDIEGLRNEAANHWVTLDVNAEGTSASVTCSGVPSSPRVEKRDHCGETWPLPVTFGGRGKRFWWVCLNECNMSSQYAVSRLRAMGDGRIEFDAVAGRRYIDFLLNKRKPRHKIPLDVYDMVEKHERSLGAVFTGEWSAEVEEAWREYDDRD